VKKRCSRAYLPLLLRPGDYLKEHLHRVLEKLQAKRGFRTRGEACIQTEDKKITASSL